MAPRMRTATTLAIHREDRPRERKAILPRRCQPGGTHPAASKRQITCVILRVRLLRDLARHRRAVARDDDFAYGCATGIAAPTPITAEPAVRGRRIRTSDRFHSGIESNPDGLDSTSGSSILLAWRRSPARSSPATCSLGDFPAHRHAGPRTRDRGGTRRSGESDPGRDRAIRDHQSGAAGAIVGAEVEARGMTAPASAEIISLGGGRCSALPYAIVLKQDLGASARACSPWQQFA